MNTKKAGVILSAGAAALLLAACGSNSSNSKSATSSKKQTMTWMETAAIVSDDPSQATDSMSFQVLLNTQEGIYRLTDKGQKYELGLAKKVDVSKDGYTYNVTLRNAKWSNGDPITAQDFVYAWRRTVDPKTKAQDAFYYSAVKNANDIIAGKKKPSELGIKATDKTHFTITLAQPTAYFKQLLAFPLFFPQDQKVVEKYGSKYATDSSKQVYSGPYRLADWNGSSDTWSLTKNNTYWDKKAVKMSTIKERVVKDPSTAMNLYNAGKLDTVTLTGALAQQQLHNKDAVNRISTNLTRIDLNEKKVPAFKNKNVRKAFSLAINRKALVNNVLKDGSKTPLGFVPVGLATNPNTGKDFATTTQVKSAVSYDLTKAKELWAKGQKETGTSKLSVTLLADDTDNSKNTAEYIQGQLQKLDGVTVTIRSIPKAQRLQEQNSSNYDMVAATWQSIYADAYNFLDVWLTGVSYNTSGWSNSKFDQLLNDGETKYGNDINKRWANQQAAEKLLMNEQATIPLYQANNLQLVKSGIKGINFNPTGIPYDFKHASVN